MANENIEFTTGKTLECQGVLEGFVQPPATLVFGRNEPAGMESHTKQVAGAAQSLVLVRGEATTMGFLGNSINHLAAERGVRRQAGEVVNVHRVRRVFKIRRGGFVTDKRNRRRGSPHNVFEDGLAQIQRVRPSHRDDVELRIYDGVGQDQLVANVRDTNAASSDSRETEMRPEFSRQTYLIKRVGQIKHLAKKGFVLMHFQAGEAVGRRQVNVFARRKVAVTAAAVKHQSLEARLLQHAEKATVANALETIDDDVMLLEFS